MGGPWWEVWRLANTLWADRPGDEMIQSPCSPTQVLNLMSNLERGSLKIAPSGNVPFTVNFTGLRLYRSTSGFLAISRALTARDSSFRAPELMDQHHRTCQVGAIALAPTDRYQALRPEWVRTDIHREARCQRPYSHATNEGVGRAT